MAVVQMAEAGPDHVVGGLSIESGRRSVDGELAGVAWNVTFGVDNHLVLLTATALFITYLAASLVLFVWRWRGCLVRLSLSKLPR